MKTFILLIAVIALCLHTLFLHANNKHEPLQLKAEIIATEEHNPLWFTQGLYHDGHGFYISSGLYGKSKLIYQTPEKTISRSLPSYYFAEGLSTIDDTLYVLTWKEQTLLMFDRKTLKPIGQRHYKGQGWGLTHNHQAFIMSNGSNTLFFRDKKTFAITRKIIVRGLKYLNELEYVNGIIWANRWYDDHIYAINSNNGCLLAKVNIHHLRQQATTSPDHKNVSNGIAYDKKQNGLWVTGKYWAKRFLIALPEIENSRSVKQCHGSRP